jgi:hypothetical protein
VNLGLSSRATATPIALGDQSITLTGTTGGPTASSCGNLATAPNLELNLDQATYMQVTVQTSADATLWIDGPSDFCILRDPNTNLLQTAGHWPEGLYKVYVGDRQGQGSSFSLTVSR